MLSLYNRCIAGLPLLICLGCTLPPEHQRAINTREQSMNQTLGMIVKNESERPRQLESTANLIVRDYQQQVENFERWGPTIDQALKNDFDRFQDRQPSYQREIMERLKGDPEGIERRLPDLY